MCLYFMQDIHKSLLAVLVMVPGLNAWILISEFISFIIS